MQDNTITPSQPELLRMINEIHERSGLSLREAAVEMDMDPSYLSYLFNGKRHFRRDMLLAMGYVYGLSRPEVDELLLVGGFPPVGIGVRYQYRRENHGREGSE